MDYEKTEFCNPKNENINTYDARITEINFVIVISWSIDYKDHDYEEFIAM